MDQLLRFFKNLIRYGYSRFHTKSITN
jgi:hypothetical protein